MVSYWLIVMAIVIISQRLGELCLARRNRLRMLQAGAREYGRSHYPLFFILHALWLAGWLTEGSLYGKISPYWYFWLLCFALAQGLRYWSIASLGICWNTRILVLPGDQRICSGPYRLLRHPNYIAVAVELVCVPLLFTAWITAILVTLLNALLLVGIRIPAEEKALALHKI